VSIRSTRFAPADPSGERLFADMRPGSFDRRSTSDGVVGSLDVRGSAAWMSPIGRMDVTS
jgi:hypothetical protein